MLFNSFIYALFLPIVLLVYYLAPRKWRVWILLVASYLFYASWNPPFLLLIISLTTINWALALWINYLKNGWSRFHQAVLALGIILNLGVLAFFKYTLFILNSLTSLLNWFGLGVKFPQPDLILPLGISFFIFEFIHYLVDVGRDKPVVRSWLNFAVFAAFFPTQIAGPIKRYELFVPQLNNPLSFNKGRTLAGLQLLLTGLFKKIVLADNLAPLVLLGFGQMAPDKIALTPGEAWLVVLAFAMQIYFDFSGYTDMGRGSALLLGFDVPENFRRPYLAVNISEFWRRWHISLSTWLRDYLYIPLGGNRLWRYRNLFLTMAIGGLWHGANWTFVVWGAYHGVLLAGYWWLKSRKWPWLSRFSRSLSGSPLLTIAGVTLTFGAVCIGWVFFRAASLAQAFSIIGAMSGFSGGQAEVFGVYERLFILIVVAGCLLVELLFEMRLRLVESGSLFYQTLKNLKPLVYSLLLILIILLSPENTIKFIYFQF